MKPKLKVCPFCGQQPEIRKNDVGQYSVACHFGARRRVCMVHPKTAWTMFEVGAVSEWNIRRKARKGKT